jgi:ribose transport system substrate-binding protein
MKKATVIAVSAIAATAVLAGCGGAKKADKGGTKITAVLMALNSDYWHMVEAGCLKGGRELGANVVVMGPTSESDVTGQIAMIEDQITSGAKGIILAPTEPKALIPVLTKAREKKIPVAIVDADIDASAKDLRLTFIGTSELAAAREVGKYLLAHKLKAGDQVGIIRGLAGSPNHTWRTDGCREVLEAAGVKVVSVQPADSERGKAVGVAENMLEAYPKISAIYATNDEMALGAYQACEGRKRTDTFVIGFDGSPDALKSIKAGKLGASLAQKPIDMGYKGVEAILKSLKGEAVEPNIESPVEIVDKANVEAFEAKLNAELAAAAPKK